MTELRDVYTDKVPVSDNMKRSRVSRLKALLLKQWERGIRGSERATQAAIANARAIGVFESPAPENVQEREDYFTDETLSCLSEQALSELVEIARKKEGQH